MKQNIMLAMCAFLLLTLIGCETAKGVTRDMANTARNIRDILGVGRDIGNIAKWKN